VMPSSETETRSRGRLALDQDGTSLEGRPAPERGGIPLEGAPNPRARQNLTRGGDRPSSEAKFYQCGTATLERSGVPPKGVQAACLAGCGSMSLTYARCQVQSFFISYEGKWVSPGCLGDPYGCPR
jgi:hypothetical protein